MTAKSIARWISIFSIGISMSMAQQSNQKNIILIMVDDMGYECVGVYGSTYLTPNLDRAAKAGVKFNHCYSTPLCTPSRNEIMTGKYNNRNYVTFGYLDRKQKTFGNIFRDSGYATCIAGKWQLGGDAQTIHNFGFDEHCLWNMFTYYDEEAKISLDMKDVLVPELKNKIQRYWNPGIYQNGTWLEQKKEEYGPDVCSNFILDFIDKNKERPFLVYYPAILVHNPFPFTPDSEKQNKKSKQNFPDMCAYTDTIVGRIEAHLKELGLYENTVILFTGDNGTNKKITTPMKNGSSIVGGKASMTDGGTHVPLIVWGGGVKANVVSDSIIDFSDMLPTIADLAGIPLPTNFKTDGKSFKPVLDGIKERVRDTIFCSYNRSGEGEPQVWARDNEYKLYADGSFYHIPSDVLEKKPIKQISEKHIAIVKKLKAVLDLNAQDQK